jgi:hypothetical protein
MKLKQIFILFFWIVSLNANAQKLSVNKLPIIADMVHNNPGEALYVSKFNTPDVIKEMGYNGKTYFIFQSPQLAINWDKIDADIMPVGSDDRKWVEAKSQNIHTLYGAMKKKGMEVYCMSDLILFPKRLIAKFGMDKTFSDPRDPKTEKYLRILIHEMFTQFPELDGIFVRIGETYLEDAPYHKGGIQNQKDADKTIIPLMNILRDEICVKLNKKLVFRTWWSFDVDAATYMKVNDAIEPHDNLTISIKHCEGDFHRGNPFSKVLGIGRHKQLVEVQCAREYEGKGAYPNYIANGVINGFEEHQALRKEGKLASIKELAERFPLFKGMWTWSRGGGWEGPYIQNELWCDLNAYVMSQWANNTNESELVIFERFATERLKLSAPDVKKFRKLALLSADAVLRGRRSVNFSESIDKLWTRDEYIGFPQLPKDGKVKTILAEKDSAIVLWKEVLALSKEIKFKDKETQSYAAVSAEYAVHLYEIYRAVYNLSAIKDGLADATSKAKWLKVYDTEWAAFEKLKKDHPDCATIYSRDKALRMPVLAADEIIKTMR